MDASHTSCPAPRHPGTVQSFQPFQLPSGTQLNVKIASLFQSHWSVQVYAGRLVGWFQSLRQFFQHRAMPETAALARAYLGVGPDHFPAWQNCAKRSVVCSHSLVRFLCRSFCVRLEVRDVLCWDADESLWQGDDRIFVWCAPIHGWFG
jgi:hypothetical protein